MKQYYDKGAKDINYTVGEQKGQANLTQSGRAHTQLLTKWGK
jgi:hypothetical protein